MPCAGHPRLPVRLSKQVVDGRDTPGHDEGKLVALSRHAQMQASLLLQIADDGEEIFRLRIAARAGHADQALGQIPGRRAVPFDNG
jgi:hypothetical protein